MLIFLGSLLLPPLFVGRTELGLNDLTVCACGSEGGMSTGVYDSVNLPLIDIFGVFRPSGFLFRWPQISA